MHKKIKNIVYSKKYQNLCRTPYHNHPKGCPNYDKRMDCPPCRLIDEIFDLRKDIYVIYTEYPVGEFAEKMRLNHPEWANQPRQWYNCIRWQGTAKKNHKQNILEFQELFPTFTVNNNPEALGVNVTDLMKKVGINLEWNYHEQHDIDRKTYRVSIAGKRLKRISRVTGLEECDNCSNEYLNGFSSHCKSCGMPIVF